MAISVVTNVASLRAQRNLANTTSAMGTHIEKLSSGVRFNKAGDDTVRSAIGSQMTAYESGLKQAARNANDGISMLQTSEGAFGEMSHIVIRMR